MFVYGEYERRVLESGAYRSGEVVVSGSPRLDLDAAAASGPGAPAERAAIRRALGIADTDRMLVVSTLHLPFVRRSHLVHMLEVVLGGPLPGVHVVFKQHPGEQDDGPYRQLLTGLAGWGLRAAADLLLRDIDLYRLLRAADAHLGLHSTVLTDAVVAGTSTSSPRSKRHGDLLGYVAAGVARPVTRVADLRAAMEHPESLDPECRRLFLFETTSARAMRASASSRPSDRRSRYRTAPARQVDRELEAAGPVGGPSRSCRPASPLLGRSPSSSGPAPTALGTASIGREFIDRHGLAIRSTRPFVVA